MFGVAVAAATVGTVVDVGSTGVDADCTVGGRAVIGVELSGLAVMPGSPEFGVVRRAVREDDFVESSPLGVDVTSVVHANSTSTSDNERAIVEPLIFLTTKNGVSFVMMAVIIG